MGGSVEVKNAFQRALAGEAQPVPPIWLMRQAGRYHRPYQELRKRHRFEDLCRIPELAAEVALGPIRDFDFDAAILFSDLLFPLEALGMSLSYDAGPPKLDGPLDRDRIMRFAPLADAAARMQFQADAIGHTRAMLPPDKGLIGFVGGPWTLFVYAMEGSHAGAMRIAKSSWSLYREFAMRVTPLLRTVVQRQLDAGADVVMILDTAAGELPPSYFHREIVPDLAPLAQSSPGRVGYYTKAAHPAHYAPPMAGLPWAGIGVDSRWDLAALLAAPGRKGFVQGNFDPAWLFLPDTDLRAALTSFLDPIAALSDADRRAWICGLGHGVLPGTPESAVRTFVDTVRKRFA
ncbi:MAG TPA: uroporphyrinogen decarboxylase family protein [Vicinamibacterales bacterium]|nr:uroporphyrinogen decarboxylase family protein [Vicinamibacterales bacterium]